MEHNKYEKYISKGGEYTTQKPLSSHKPTGAELGPLYTLLEESIIPNSGIRVAVRHILKGRTIHEYPDHIDPHIHDVSKAYVILSEDAGNLEADVTLGKEKYAIKSPAAAFVPAGLEHNIKITKGHGFLIVVMPMKGTYNEHTFPVSKDGA
jgi:mannose-6-phosphate isomerase-like protein (cupin superfamily)